ncbi:MAG: hypothetical protein HYY26_06865 [Acidobacteria bacterium]|nr:hypothetical protein [Acidobacteriota bacterium]
MKRSDAKREPLPRQASSAAQARRLRGAILALLAEQSPERLNADVLLGVLERLHYDVTARELAAALAYLRSRGYVEFEELRSRELPALPRIVRVGITAQGADVVDGTTEDPGVDWPRSWKLEA